MTSHTPRTRRHSTWQHPRGFTLVEMMVVIGVIAILASLASPSLYRMSKRERSREYATSIANQLKTARLQARTQGQPLRVTITPGTGVGEDNGSILIQRAEPYCRSSLGRRPTRGLCPDGMPPKPPITCSELNTQASFQNLTTEDVHQINPRAISADNFIAGTMQGTAPVTLCFSPDGSILNATGAVLSDTQGISCSGENFYIYTANAQRPTAPIYATSTSLSELAKCTPSNAAPGQISAARDEMDLFRIILPYNGAIRASQ